jgi:8-oxo-dGTP pyrophosphatase MutT (NUDIX family)
MNGQILSDVSKRLQQRLDEPLPGRAAQRAFAPELSYGRHHGPRRIDTRPAAVLALLCREDHSWYVPLTLRPETMQDHAGQICLPGGLIESDETDQGCATREMHEELGVASRQYAILGRLTPLVVHASNFEITPIVGCATQQIEFDVNTIEVAELIRLPIDVLLDPAARGQMEIRKGPLRFLAPCFQFNRHRIWGATSMILAELAQVIRECNFL